MLVALRENEAPPDTEAASPIEQVRTRACVVVCIRRLRSRRHGRIYQPAKSDVFLALNSFELQTPRPPMKTVSFVRALALLTIAWSTVCSRAADLPLVPKVELQPLAAHVARLSHRADRGVGHPSPHRRAHPERRGRVSRPPARTDSRRDVPRGHGRGDGGLTRWMPSRRVVESSSRRGFSCRLVDSIPRRLILLPSAFCLLP